MDIGILSLLFRGPAVAPGMDAGQAQSDSQGAANPFQQVMEQALTASGIPAAVFTEAPNLTDVPNISSMPVLLTPSSLTEEQLPDQQLSADFFQPVATDEAIPLIPVSFASDASLAFTQAQLNQNSQVPAQDDEDTSTATLESLLQARHLPVAPPQKTLLPDVADQETVLTIADAVPVADQAVEPSIDTNMIGVPPTDAVVASPLAAPLLAQANKDLKADDVSELENIAGLEDGGEDNAQALYAEYLLVPINNTTSDSGENALPISILSGVLANPDTGIEKNPGWLAATPTPDAIRLTLAQQANGDEAVDVPGEDWQEMLRATMDKQDGQASDVDLDAVIRRILSQPVQGKMSNGDELASNGAMPLFAQPAVSILDEASVDVASAGDGDVSGTQSVQPHSSQSSHAQSVKSPVVFLASGNPNASPAEQVHVSIRQAFKPGMDRMVVQLEPKDLGKVEVRIDVNQQGHSHITFTADNSDTINLLQRDARMLESALKDMGMNANASDMQFNLSKQNQGDGGGSQHEAGTGAYYDPLDDVVEPGTYMDPLTGNYTLTVNEGLDIRV